MQIARIVDHQQVLQFGAVAVFLAPVETSLGLPVLSEAAWWQTRWPNRIHDEPARSRRRLGNHQTKGAVPCVKGGAQIRAPLESHLLREQLELRELSPGFIAVLFFGFFEDLSQVASTMVTKFGSKYFSCWSSLSP